MNKLTRAALALALVFVAACSEDAKDDKNNASANNGTPDMVTTPDQSTTPDQGTTPDQSTTPDMDTTPDMEADQGADMTTYPPAASCAEISLVECLASSECGADERCQNLPGKGDVANITCCVKGERGAGMPGDACDDEFDCESGLCIEDDNGKACSKDCMADADCPTILPRCSAIGVCRPPL